MAQKAMEMNNGVTPNTMASSAENQKESEKVKANAPTAPAPMMAIICSKETISPFGTTSLFARWVIVQNRKRMVKPLLMEDSRFTWTAACGLATVASQLPLNK